jgi:ATP-dependent Clp protease protease subunit|nr:MAG TPA: Putative ATP dependent Clp protease [Caudoviricetes sp.]
MKRKFWNWVKNEGELESTRTLFLNGEISDETWYGDEVTPQLFKDELNADSGDITVWINSPGGDVFAAAQIYNMLRDYKGHVTVKIDGLAASAASVIAVAGDTVLVSPVAMMMIHNPATIAMGNTKDMEAAIAMLNEVKESILNAYVDKTGLSRNKLSKMMDDETWFNAKKAVELGFADKVLFAAEEKKKPEEDQDPDEKEEKEPEEDGEGDEDEKKKKFSFQNAYAYSRKSVADSFLNKVSDKAPEKATVPVDQLRKRLDLLKR